MFYITLPSIYIPLPEARGTKPRAPIEPSAPSEGQAETARIDRVAKARRSLIQAVAETSSLLSNSSSSIVTVSSDGSSKSSRDSWSEDSATSARKAIQVASNSEIATKLKISERQLERGRRANPQFEKEMELNFKKYQKAFRQFETTAGDLRHASTGKNVKLTSKQLMKVTAKSLMVLEENKSSWICLGPLKEKALITKKEGGELNIVKSKHKDLGQGSSGVVVKLFSSVTEGTRVAVKLADPDNDQGAENDIKNGIAVANHIWEGESDFEGIQEKFHAAVDLTIEGNKTIGVIGPYYKTKGSNLILFSVLIGNLALSFMKQAMTGLATLHGKNVCHCDLKGENLLVRDTSSKRGANFQVAIGDLGGAQVIDGVNLINKWHRPLAGRGDYTPAYTNASDDMVIKQLAGELADKIVTKKKGKKYNEAVKVILQQGDISSLKIKKNDLALYNDAVKKVLQQGDVYSLTLALYEIFTGLRYSPKEVCPLSRVQLITQRNLLRHTGQDFTNEGSFQKHRLEEIGFPKNLISLMSQALDNNPAQRPTAQQFVDALSLKRFVDPDGQTIQEV